MMGGATSHRYDYQVHSHCSDLSLIRQHQNRSRICRTQPCSSTALAIIASMHAGIHISTPTVLCIIASMHPCIHTSTHVEKFSPPGWPANPVRPIQLSNIHASTRPIPSNFLPITQGLSLSARSHCCPVQARSSVPAPRCTGLSSKVQRSLSSVIGQPRLVSWSTVWSLSPSSSLSRSVSSAKVHYTKTLKQIISPKKCAVTKQGR